MNDKIKDLQRQIEEERRKIANCKHDFNKSFYNPETVKEVSSYKMVAQGSDVWSEPDSYKETQKPRWTRKCKHCGLEQHTYKQSPIISGFEPSFE